MGKVLLVGEAHRDPWLSVYAESLLRAEKPSAITHEHTHIQHTIYKSLRSKAEELLRQNDIPDNAIPEFVSKFMRRFRFPDDDGRYAFPVVEVCEDYARSEKIPLKFVGHPDFKSLDMLLNLYNRPLNREDVLNPPWPPPIEPRTKYDNFRQRLQTDGYSGVPEEDRCCLRTHAQGDLRDVYTAQRIEDLILKGRELVCHFCGLCHMLDDDRGETLYSILKQKHEVRRIAIDHHFPDGGKADHHQ